MWYTFTIVVWIGEYEIPIIIYFSFSIKLYFVPPNSKTLANRKFQDYVYVKWEHQSNMLGMRHYLRRENKGKWK